jgi:uncharacterized membrane protein YadS
MPAAAAQGTLRTRLVQVFAYLSLVQGDPAVHVILLAPLVSYFAYKHRRAHKSATSDAVTVTKTSPLPLFIVLFLGMVCVRTTGALSDDVLHNFKNLEKTLLAMALVGLGAGVNIKKLRVLGSRPLILGLLSWLLVMGTSLATIRLIPLDF